MKPGQLLLAALFCAVISTSAPGQAGDDERPNIILIVADDLGWADLACYGSQFHRTPHLDKMAAVGRRFTQAYAACPVCSPTRASLLTGKHPARLHLTDWLPGRADMPSQRLLRAQLVGQLPLAEVTLAERLKLAGYATALIGKWHLGGKDFEPQTQGFDVNVAGDQSGSPASYFAPYRRGNRMIEALIGCGHGSGGSMVEFRAADQVLELTVPETGGFQQFVSRKLGSLKFDRAGRYKLEVRAANKPGPAVMDLREVQLIPAGN